MTVEETPSEAEGWSRKIWEEELSSLCLLHLTQIQADLLSLQNLIFRLVIFNIISMWKNAEGLYGLQLPYSRKGARLFCASLWRPVVGVSVYFNSTWFPQVSLKHCIHWINGHSHHQFGVLFWISITRSLMLYLGSPRPFDRGPDPQWHHDSSKCWQEGLSSR